MGASQPSDHVSAAWTRAQPTVSSYINALVPDFHAAEDILQAVAVIVVRKFDQFDDAKPFLAWALGIARNEVLHHRRSKAREHVMFNGELMEMLASGFAQQEEQSKEIRRAMGNCLGKLSDRPKEVFRLRYGEDMPVNGIAEALHTTPSSISVTLHRCREALRKCLTQNLGEGLWNK